MLGDENKKEQLLFKNKTDLQTSSENVTHLLSDETINQLVFYQK